MKRKLFWVMMFAAMLASGETVECSDWNAVGTAISNGKNAILVADATVTTSANAINSQNVTIDFNGHSVVRPYMFNAIHVGGTATVTLIDSSVGKTGGFIPKSGDTPQGYATVWVNGSGKLICNQAKFSNLISTRFGVCFFVENNAQVVINGGVFENCVGQIGGPIVYLDGSGTSAIINGGVANNCTGGSGEIAYIVNGGQMTVNGLICESEPGTSGFSNVSTYTYGSYSRVGDKYIVGSNITSSDGKLTGGTFTFDPIESIYSAFVAPGSRSVANGGTPPTWTLSKASSGTTIIYR